MAKKKSKKSLKADDGDLKQSSIHFRPEVHRRIQDIVHKVKRVHPQFSNSVFVENAVITAIKKFEGNEHRLGVDRAEI